MWPLAPVYAVRTTKVEGETKGKAGAGGVTSSDLNRKEGVLSQEELLEEMASNKELNLNRKDDSVHQRVQQVAAGRRYVMSNEQHTVYFSLFICQYMAILKNKFSWEKIMTSLKA